ncbi:MAG TPA: NAD(P)-dependent oxidoreductase [Candidatus Sumerlaeota bacterium]|nr:NAD(P)-dependent oxidoreductase [Candidatus Sumerlaeota bacterium]
MTKPFVLISSPIAIAHPEPYVSALRRAGFDVVLHMPPGQCLDEAEVMHFSPNILAIVCGDDSVTRRVIDANPHLKTICKWGVGIDSIDWAYCAERGISVRNVQGVHSQSMAEAACGYTLMLYKKLGAVDRMVREGRWEKVVSHRFEGSTIGLVGLGNIGWRTARMMSGWPVKLLAYDPRPEAMPNFSGERVTRDELFSRSDCIVIMAPPPTERVRVHGVGLEPELDKVMHLLKPGALYVNVSRGALSPAKALEECLERGLIAAAALDVYEVEPLPKNSRLRGEFADRVVFGAHTAYNCPGISEKVTRLTFENLFEELGCPLP